MLSELSEVFEKMDGCMSDGWKEWDVEWTTEGWRIDCWGSDRMDTESGWEEWSESKDDEGRMSRERKRSGRNGRGERDRSEWDNEGRNLRHLDAPTNKNRQQQNSRQANHISTLMPTGDICVGLSKDV